MENKLEIQIKHKDIELSKEIRSLLEEEAKKGTFTFEMKTKRICDFCGKVLTANVNFITLEDGNDKCEECQKNGK